MTIAQEYFKNQYDAYLRLKTQMELQDLETELELEQESFEQDNLYSDDFLDFIDEMADD